MRGLIFCVLVILGGCSKAVDVHRESYKDVEGYFKFHDKKYSVSKQLELLGESVRVDFLPQTYSGFRSTSYKGPYRIKISVVDMDAIDVNINYINIYDASCGNILYKNDLSKIHASLEQLTDLDVSQYVCDELFKRESKSIVVALSLDVTRSGSTSVEQHSIYYKYVFTVENKNIQIPIISV